MALKTAETYSTVWEAGMAKSILEEEGITAVSDEDTTQPFLGIPLTAGRTGYRVMVNEADLDRAQAILRDWEETRDKTEGNAEEVEDEGEEEDVEEEPEEEEEEQ